MGYPIHVSFRCDKELERRLRVEAAKQDMNRTEFIIEALIEKLERLEIESNKTEAEFI